MGIKSLNEKTVARSMVISGSVSLAILLMVFTSGCASIQQKEQEDPGYGGFHEALRRGGMGIQLICSPANQAMRYAPAVLFNDSLSDNQ